jgi:hypothetical protein
MRSHAWIRLCRWMAVGYTLSYIALLLAGKLAGAVAALACAVVSLILGYFWPLASTTEVRDG